MRSSSISTSAVFGSEAGNRRGIDLEREHLLLAVHLHGDGAAAGGGFDDGAGEALLHLLLHLLRLAEHFLNVLRGSIDVLSYCRRSFMACPGGQGCCAPRRGRAPVPASPVDCRARATGCCPWRRGARAVRARRSHRQAARQFRTAAGLLQRGAGDALGLRIHGEGEHGLLRRDRDGDGVVRDVPLAAAKQSSLPSRVLCRAAPA